MENRNSVLGPSAYQKQIRQRLNELRNRHQQSDIARKTQTPLTNVHRYMNTGKIPAEFCAALVSAYSINPSWLLVGQGGASLSDVTEHTAALGQNLLALVESMMAVAKMRLGALAGKGHQKVLRELSDALSAHERLREKLNAMSRPVFAGLLNELAAHLQAMEGDKAATVRQAALEISRLCDDETLQLRFEGLQGDLEYLRGSLEKSLEFSRRVFSHSLRRGALREEESLSYTLGLLMSLKDTGRYREALRTAKAALALASDHGRKWQSYHQVELFTGHLEIELGMARKGLARVQKAYTMIKSAQPEARQLANIVMARALWLCGLLTLAQARTFPPSPGNSRQLVRAASFSEDTAELREACKAHIGTAPGCLPPNDFESGRAKLLLQALAGKAHWLDFERHAAQNPLPNAAVRELAMAAYSAQFARLCGDMPQAEAQSLRFEELVASLPEEITVNIEFCALHHRTILELAKQGRAFATTARAKAARKFFARHVAAGFGFFAPILRR